MGDELSADTILEVLRILGWVYVWASVAPNLWTSYCPVCRFQSLTILEGFTRVRLSCKHRCAEPEILSAFSELLEPITVDEALGYAEEAVRVANDALRRQP